MSNGKFSSTSGKKFTAFLGKQGFYLLMIACVGIIGTTALVGALGSKDKQINNKPMATATPTERPVSNNQAIIQDNENQQISDETVDKIVLLQPVEGEVLKAHAMDALVYSSTLKQWQTHSGIDIKASEGAQVSAALDGTVESVTQDALMGNTVVIRHDKDTCSVYSSLKNATVKKGDKVIVGQAI
jgi:murein DD-endopeptidase MepM/ murein hydrolase activator NlpD